ncbi:MAG: hypothetical protein AAFZ15_11725 [Bacteroidota bacterium]
MKIIELRILPPIAIGRLGASKTPLDAYTLELSKEKPLDFRKIVPKESFTINPKTGAIKSRKPRKIKFKEAKNINDKNGKIHPVAPFLEVFAITDEEPGLLVPLTTGLLKKCGRSIDDISWKVEVGNIKIFRRTGNPDDKIIAAIDNLDSHSIQSLDGKCNNFLKGKTLPLGHVQFVKPSREHPEIRFRYTPAAGKVYGTRTKRIETEGAKPVPDPIITSDDLVLYDEKKGDWLNYEEGASFDPTYTNPAQIFAGYATAAGAQVSWGYLDDECDGFAEVHLKGKEVKRKGKMVVVEKPLKARAHIGAGPPAFAPDTLPVRVVIDELEQILLSPEVEGTVSIEKAEELVRRAFETVRLMNSAVMNGNAINGREDVASTMVRQDAADFSRLYEPIMATSLVDNLALRVLHERVFNGLSTGAAAWFADALRRPNEIGDLSNEGRRKMPALMRNADGRALCFTHRQINTIIKAAINSIFSELPAGQEDDAAHEVVPIKADDLKAQLQYRGQGNPFSVLPRTAISNCFPGLEFDFRNLWRRSFKEIILIENNNYVLDAIRGFEHLIHHRLVAVDWVPTMVPTWGPVRPGADPERLKTANNPNGVSFMEWSNNLAAVLQKGGQKVTCHFTKRVSKDEVTVIEKLKEDNDYRKELSDKRKYIAVELTVNHIFKGKSAAIADQVLEPGELTQGLCAPWQNDYRECACYYWAASRPDYVNVEPGENGLSKGDNWLAKERSGTYIPDNRVDTRLVSYDDLFANWQGELNFLLKGNDALGT